VSSLGAGVSAPLYASALGLSVPPNATITGVKVAFSARATEASGNPYIIAQLVLGGSQGYLGSAINIPIAANGASLAPYNYGSSTFQWGTTLTPAIVNDPTFGFDLSAFTGTLSNNFHYYLNSLVVTVYYTTSATTEILTANSFGFSISLSSGVSGFNTTFKAYSSAATSAVFQLLENGVPQGTPKTLPLTTTPTVYNLGGPEDPWGYVWSAANVNSPQFGIQITAEGVGTTYVGDLDITTFITPALANFNWIGTYEQNNAALTTLALDADGNMWAENVLNNPGVLSLSLSGLIPGSYAVGATINDSEFIMFSDLNIGTDRPRQLYNDGNWYPVTQVGPGSAPTFLASTGGITNTLNISAYTAVAGTPTIPASTTFTISPAAAVAPVVGSLYVLSGFTGPDAVLNGQVVTVLTGATTASFSADVSVTAPGNTSVVALATLTFAYPIESIKQLGYIASGLSGGVLWFLLSTGPNQSAQGSVVTVYYSYASSSIPPNSNLQNAWNAAVAGTGPPVYVQINNAANVNGYNFDGIWQVTGIGYNHFLGYSEQGYYFTFQYTESGFANGTNNATAYLTQATLTLASPGVVGITNNTPITITGVTGNTPDQVGYNNTWVITNAVNTGQYNITESQYNGAGVATFTYNFASLTNSQAPVVGNTIQIIGVTNNAAMNGTFAISAVNAGASTFSILVTIPGLAAQPSAIAENSAQATMAGTQFIFDPGALLAGSASGNAIFGTATDGDVSFIGVTLVPIGAGTRQGVVFFITKTGSWTPASPPVTFTIAADANQLNVSNIPIGPPDVVGRGIAITEAGANGVPGANFYVIETAVTTTVNTVVTTNTSTVINDNTSTTASFSFSDAVLLNSTEVDVPSLDIFNTIEIGSCAWCVPYSSRMFYGLQLNKVQNFNNLTFDGGYVVPNQPAGWGLNLATSVPTELELITSPVTGDAIYILNSTGSIQPQFGMLYQTAYQDPYNVAIIQNNTAYSVRVACSCPSGVAIGNLVIDLTQFNNGNFTQGANGLGVYGSFVLPLSEMSPSVRVYTGPLLAASVFTGNVDPYLTFRVWAQNMGLGADLLIDRIEVYPTLFPYLKTEVYGSYIGRPEMVDASGDGGIIDTSTENPQPVMGAFVLRDSLYLLKTNSMYVTKDNPTSEPSGWSINEIDNRAGACGINAYDTGEEWAIMACRNGIYGFDGGKPELLNLEILQVWNCINWNAGNSICLRNDTENRRILCAVPLPTGTSPDGVATATTTWLPYAPYNPAPTTPNVILVCNYEAIGSFEELLKDIGTHATMFGSLANPDMRRKWTIWNIPTPYIGHVTRGNLLDIPLFICNGIDSSKIYQLDDNALSDDGAPIHSLYCTYSFVNAQKAVTMPILGMHNKRYTVLQFNAQGEGQMNVTMFPNDLGCRYPLTVPLGLPYGITLGYPINDDYVRPINIKGQRVFLQFETNATNSWFELCKVLITGKQDPWSSISPVGGGNLGIT
jgi:hypothetical protein